VYRTVYYLAAKIPRSLEKIYALIDLIEFYKSNIDTVARIVRSYCSADKIVIPLFVEGNLVCGLGCYQTHDVVYKCVVR